MNHSRDVAPQYMACRSYLHAWDFTTVERKGGEYEQGMRCLRCGTEKYVRINARNGLREHGARYVYPEQLNPGADPYQMPKDTGGALTADERGQILLGFVKGAYESRVDTLAARRRARKKSS